VQLKLQMADALRNSALVWKLHALALAAKSATESAPERKLLALAQAYRRWPNRALRRRLAPWLETDRACIWREKKIGWQRYQQQTASPVLTKSLVLKAPGNGEKGVLYVSFEYNWLRLLRHYDVPALLREYDLVCASSWSPPDFPAHWALARIGPGPVWMQISNPSDMQLYRQFDHRIEPVPIMASDWINPDFYRPRPHERREIDLLMVAGWSHVKRHWLLFRALRRMRRNLRVVLIGQDADGRTAEDVYRQARAFGVAGRIELLSDLPIERVTEHQCNARCSVILSAREGSCVVVAESLFADTPVAMMHDAHVGSRAYINEQTGVLLEPATMHIRLSELIERSGSFRPREWAVAHISCHHARRKLSELLQRELVPMCWRPDPVYVNAEDELRLAPAYEQLRQRHGIVVAGHEPASPVSSARP
jgi:glycosyltransferase involved in cell wall biosynthesis